MGEFRYFTNSEHDKIRTSPEVCAEITRLAKKFADEAGVIAGDPGGYKNDLNIGTDRARANVWPKSKKAKLAEAKTAPLMQVVANAGPTLGRLK